MSMIINISGLKILFERSANELILTFHLFFYPHVTFTYTLITNKQIRKSIYKNAIKYDYFR